MKMPALHFRANLITAISKEGKVQITIYQGSLNATVSLEFLNRLVDGASRKILLIADRLQAQRRRK